LRIAVIGWGSLIWCPGILRLKTKWRSDGPKLPIEFARISGDGRLTLVIHPGVAEQVTYWAVSEFEELSVAKTNLKNREHAKGSDIHGMRMSDEPVETHETVRTNIRCWLEEKKKDVDAAIWTGLPSNWDKKRNGNAFSPADAVRYLEELERAKDSAISVYNNARDYVQNTPSIISTEVRRSMQQRGWTDAQLSDGLFEISGETTPPVADPAIPEGEGAK
jgi:hypothetical protein